MSDKSFKAVEAMINIFARLYPRPRTALEHENAFQLLVATILSAQSTDKKVNQITPRLFARCPTPAAFLELTEDELADLIRQIGLYRSKARHILAACRLLQEEYSGEIPRTREDLMRLPGVGRKTANVVLTNAFGIPAIAVDTHVFRVSRRIGLAAGNTPEKVEQELMERLPVERWHDMHHWLILHGRQVCPARRPRCEACGIAAYCDTGGAVLAGSGAS
ncbi:MAG: endonuclease III [Thermaerobacterales bacterium]